MITADQTDQQLEQLIDEVADRLAAGERIDLDDLENAIPKHAQRLRALLPALKGMSKLQEAVGRTPPALGDFRLLREIGHGGMGTVYEAEQISMGRRVALKVLPFAALATENALKRFHNEVRAAASLDHPHIVSVYSVGEERGVHYYAMQLIRGQSLANVIAQLCSANGRADEDQVGWPTAELTETRLRDSPRVEQALVSTVITPHLQVERYRTTARLGIQAAEALQHSHDQGVLHRDIKPANLLLDSKGRLYVSDFGLARIEADAGMTISGELVGTLRYMSPEQALGKRTVIDHRADIYGLGATLYELLTLRPLFDGANRSELLSKIAIEEPTPPSKIYPNIPADLETIVLKAVAKGPDERYETAQELADDLQAFSDHRPIKARRPGLLEKVARWSRRHIYFAASLMIVLTVGVLCLATSSILIGNALGRARSAQTQTLLEHNKALYNLYVANMRLAREEWQNGNLDVVHKLLEAHLPVTGQPDLRGWEWRYLKAICHRDLVSFRGHSQRVKGVDWSPDGRRLVTCSNDCTLKIWDVASERHLQTLLGHEALVWSTEWSPDGRLVASASWDKTVRIWNATTGEMELKLAAGKKAMRDVAWSPDGKKLATCGDDSLVRIWDTTTGVELLQLKGHSDVVWSVDWSPDGTRVASVGNFPKPDIRVWDTITGEQIHEIIHAHGNTIVWVNWSPDSEKLATVSMDQQLKVWDARAAKIVWQADTQGGLSCVSWSPDGSSLASAGSDAAVKLWDAHEGRVLRVLRGHLATVSSVDWSPDGKRLASVSADGIAKVWDPGAEQTSRRIAGGAGADWSPDGRHIAAAGLEVSQGAGPCIKIIDAGTEAVTHSFTTNLPEDTQIGRIAWSPDGNSIAYCPINPINGVSQTINVLEYPGGAGFASLPVLQDNLGKIWSIAWSHDSHRLAAAVLEGGENQVVVWDILTGEQVAQLSHDRAPIDSVAWNPDGTRLATTSWNQLVKVWDTTRWREIMKLHRDPSWPASGIVAGGEHMIDWSSDGKSLAAGAVNGWVIVWDGTSGRETISFSAHAGKVGSIAFSPDATRIATVGADRSLKIWDASTGEHLLTLSGSSSFDSIKWSPDGSRLLTRGDGIRLWDASTVIDAHKNQ